MKQEFPPILGAVPDIPDDRDFIFEEVMGAPLPEMPSFEQGYDTEEKIGKLRDKHQGYTLGCVTFGGTNDIQMSILATAKQTVQLSQRDAYSQIWIRPNGASSPRDFYKLANQKGICEDTFLPTNAGETLREEWLRNRNDITSVAIQNALKWRIGPYYSIVSLQIDAIAQAIFQNDGCGGAYMPIGGNLGHMIFFKGYGMYHGYKSLRIKDSYSPYEKWIRCKDNKYYYSDPPDMPISLFSIWTFQAGDWGQKTMATKLVRKKNTQEVFIVLNGKRYWIKESPNFEDLKVAQPLNDIQWEKVQEIDIFTEPYEGDIIGKPNFSDYLKNLFGKVS